MIHAVFGVIYLLFMYKLPIVFLSMTMLFTFYMAMKTARKYIIFITLFSWLGIQGLFEMANQSHLLFGILTEDDYFRGLIMMYWLMMRLASFALQYCDEFIDPKKSLEKIRQRFSLINLLGFSYYLPVLTLGLPLLFSRYANVLGENELRKNGNLSIRIKILIIELFRIIMTGFIAVLMMHYIYTNPIYHDEYVSLIEHPLKIAFIVKKFYISACTRIEWMANLWNDSKYYDVFLLDSHDEIPIVWRIFSV